MFGNIRPKCLKTYDFDLVHFYSLPRLASFAASTMTEIESEPFSNIDMLLMVERGIREGIFHAVLQHVRTNSKYMEHYDENKDT